MATTVDERLDALEQAVAVLDERVENAIAGLARFAEELDRRLGVAKDRERLAEGGPIAPSARVDDWSAERLSTDELRALLALIAKGHPE